MAAANDSKTKEIRAQRVKTEYYPGMLDAKLSQDWFENLKSGIKWQEGVRSKNGSTRLTCPLMLGDNELVDTILALVLSKLKLASEDIWGIYLNYYRNGQDYMPNHSHKDTKQLVISLGVTRILEVGKKKYLMSNGDIIVFDSSTHGVAKHQGLNEGRISISCFIGNTLKSAANNKVQTTQEETEMSATMDLFIEGDPQLDINVDKLLKKMLGDVPFKITGIQRLL
jgi:uncharacterized cupin superfamily protein